MYLLFLVFFEDLPVSTVLLILYGIIMGVQVVVFILRSRWEYVWWFFIYFTIGLPVFYLILPTYSFWNMDDFSWGKTRAVGGSGVANAGGEEGDDGDEDDDEDSDYSDEDDEDDETAALTRRSGATGRSRGSQRSGSRPSGARFRDEDESSSEEESSDEEESEDDETEYSRSMADQNDYYSQASRSRFSSPR
ncbi:hypothetical protein THAOC_02591 [Thalassiosira oceanica]|uniref:Translocation protein SEC62 n=1 Tax=Thalassiosira oceanica TaxID=159749 RepID=K0TQA0_THAOC|nr:hypothetical protein THAOC_02591 [Thalassiosira oceanica]|eukprot:EJK75682.1 hypothetical protein THAOC_02591 [Thalassiosira oceanica]